MFCTEILKTVTSFPIYNYLGRSIANFLIAWEVRTLIPGYIASREESHELSDCVCMELLPSVITINLSYNNTHIFRRNVIFIRECLLRKLQRHLGTVMTKSGYSLI